MLMGDISVAELLGRDTEPVYGPEAHGIIKDATVLVTGAGGSIGSEIGRQLRCLGAGNIVYVDNNEYNLYLLERELRGTAALTDDSIVLADVQNLNALSKVLADHRPELVFHAAAVKHLPLLERSPAIAILTNVLGTCNVASASAAHGVKRLVNVSTDKAANPTSILGMTKRLAEIVVRHFASREMLVASVRFGNVFNSRGSFVETFAWQIASGIPVTITDPAMTRYFMTIPQAAGLLIEAAVMANGGDTFILDMGESYSIVNLLQRYVTLSGAQKPKIVFTGARQGEKLHEQLFDGREVAHCTQHPAISRVTVSDGVSLQEIERLCLDAHHEVDFGVLRADLERLVAGDQDLRGRTSPRRYQRRPIRLHRLTRPRPPLGWRRPAPVTVGAEA